MNSTKIKAIAIATIATLIAIWLGMNAATAQIETIMWVMGVGTIIVCAMLGSKIWMILPFAATLNLTLMIPGQPSTILLSQALFIGFSGMLILLRKLPFRLQITELEIWILLLVLCAGQVYLRHPVGLNIFGSESIGARPYAIFGAGIVSALLVAGLKVPHKDLTMYFRIHIIGGLLNFTMLAIGYFTPKVGVWYGSVNVDSLSQGGYQEGTYGVERATRIQFTRDISNNLALWISAIKSPIRACFHPIWAPLVLLTFAFAALSGYRSEIVYVGLTYLVGIIYRGGLRWVSVATAVLAAGFMIMALLNSVSPLPSNIQRSLTFLPGTWDEVHKKDAEDSTLWRTEMWKEALFTKYWIQNKWLGDGLGMTQQEFSYVQSLKSKQISGQAGTSKLTLQQEIMMASNSYHSGPVSTIRAIGYLGLLILLGAQIRLAVHAHRQIKRARNTQWYPLTLLIGIPLISSPIFFTFVFGDFGQAMASFLYGVAMVRLLENSLTPQSLLLNVKNNAHDISLAKISDTQ
ncbi:MAG: hypothetical protein ACO3S0_10555 [bacterium]